MTSAYDLIPAKRLPVVAVFLALSNFMVILDMTIANGAVPHIAGSLGVSLDESTWIITSYAVAEAITVPLTGWIAQRFGTLRSYVFCMLGFGLFSLLCGSSMTLTQIVLCRIGQGLTGGPMMPLSQTILMRSFPPEKRGMAIGLWILTTLMGPAVGPILGGSITDTLGWNWIFLINVPFVLICVFGALATLRPIETERVKLPIDRGGLFLLIFWIACLQIMLDIGRNHDWFADWKIVLLGIFALLGFIAFVIWELTEDHPAVDLRVFRSVGFSVGVGSLALIFGAYFATIVVMPQWLQTDLGYSARDAGLITAGSAFSAIATAPIVSKMLNTYDPRALVTGGAIWMAAATMMRSGWTSGSDYWTLALPNILQGLAMPFVMVPLNSTTLTMVEPEETASAAGLMNFSRTIAVAFSTSIILSIWGNFTRAAQSDLVSHMQGDVAMQSMAASGFNPTQSQMVLTNMVNREALVIALNQTSVASAVLMFFCAFIVWLGPRAKGGVGMPMH